MQCFLARHWLSSNLMMTAEYLPAPPQSQMTRTGLAEVGEQAETLSGRGDCKVNRKSSQWIICITQFDIFSDQRTVWVIYLSRLTEADCGALRHWWLGCSHVSVLIQMGPFSIVFGKHYPVRGVLLPPSHQHTISLSFNTLPVSCLVLTQATVFLRKTTYIISILSRQTTILTS